MKRKLFTITVSVVLLVLAVSGCSKMPQEQLTAAQSAIEAARAADAQRYLPDEFNALNDSLNKAMTEIEAQNSKFFITRNFDKASQTLSGVVANANAVVEQTAAKKQEVQSEVMQMLSDIKSEIEITRELIAQAPKGKEGKAALQAMESELVVVERVATEVSGLVTAGDYLAARDKLSAGMQKVMDIQNELQTAIAKRSGKRTSMN